LQIIEFPFFRGFFWWSGGRSRKEKAFKHFRGRAREAGSAAEVLIYFT